MKTQFILFAILTVFLLSACNKKDENPFPLQIDSIGNITDTSAVVYITDLNPNFEEANYHPFVCLNKTGNPTFDNKDQFFTSDKWKQAKYEIYMNKLQTKTKYFVTTTAVGIYYSNEVSFTTK